MVTLTARSALWSAHPIVNTMNHVQTEAITKAAQCADLLIGDLREAHKQTSSDAQALELLLRELTSEAVKIRNALGQLLVC
jgi:hypothetical protein